MQNDSLIQNDVYLEDVNPADFYGVNNAHFELLQKAYPEVRFIARGSAVKTLGRADRLETVKNVIESILSEIRTHGALDKRRVVEILQTAPEELKNIPDPRLLEPDVIVRGPNGLMVRARTEGQRRIVEFSAENDVVIAIGPAGSGKTYTAVALAVRALKDKVVKKIVLVRPAVEAGERLGFLPGDLKEKIDPYLRPLYDALEDMIPAEKLAVYMERNVIEIAPLAYMRGRTLNHAYIILDEAQNATELQMKMLLTRMGAESKIIVTGDETQIDLPRTVRSGLLHAVRLLSNVSGIGIVRLTERDVVRHRLVKQIILAYERDARAHPDARRPDAPPEPPKAQAPMDGPIEE